MLPEEWDRKAAAVIAEFRANRGRVGGEFKGYPLLLLHTMDLQTSRMQVNAMMFLEDGGRRIVFASHSGLPYNPRWYDNLVASPEVVVEVEGRVETALAEVLTGDERRRLYAVQAALYPAFAEYETLTDREIPVVALVPAES
jgi:deazaflavin-dependent oxidoreductase (nitroreductase family)